MKLILVLVLSVACGGALAKGGGGGRSSGSHSGHSYGSSHGSSGSHSVRGHVKRDGTYVQPHRSTNPDSTTKNNWSHKGNTNPYTGKEGTKQD